MRAVVAISAAALAAVPAHAQDGYVMSVTQSKRASAPVAKGHYTAPTPAAAQSLVPAPVQEPAAQQLVSATLLQGTAVYTTTEREVSSKVARVGDRIPLRVAEDVVVDGVTVIRAGTPGTGEVTRIDKKGMFGKSGKIEARVLSVRVGKHSISLTGTANDEGSGGTAGVVAAALLLWPVAPFVTGKSATLPPGTRMTGWVESDVPMLVRPPATQQAIVVN